MEGYTGEMLQILSATIEGDWFYLLHFVARKRKRSVGAGMVIGLKKKESLIFLSNLPLNQMLGMALENAKG